MKRPFIAVAALLTACATQTGVVPIGQDTYMVSRQGFIVTQSVTAIKAEAFKEAGAYCQSQGKNLQVINTRELEGIPARRLPTAEIQFSCLDAGDRDLHRPRLQTRPDIVIEKR